MSLLLLLLAVLLVCAFCASAGADAVDDYVLTQMRVRQIPGLSLAVARCGRLLKARGYGLANVELRVPATARTVYQIQSVTKQFTATAVMMLVEEGRIGLDEPLSRYLEGTPGAWKDVTIRHLLSHTSGIKDFINEPTASLRLDVTEEEVFQATAPRELNFPTGERYAYSNTGYHLLAMVIRRLTDRSWGEMVEECICRPLGMRDTRVLGLREIIPNRASGYALGGDGLLNGEYVAESILAYAGGGLRSTVLDLARWDAALCGEKLLKRSSLEQMWTSATLNDGKPAGYGFGWGVGEANGRRMVSHTGGHMTGFGTVITRFLDDGLTVIALTNLSGANASAVARGVAALYEPALAPPVREPIADTEPGVTGLLRDLARRIVAGTVQPDLLTPEYWEAVHPDRLQAARGFLRPLGELQGTALLDRKEDGANRVYQYRLTYPAGPLVAALTLDGGGKVAALSLEPE